MSINAAEYIYNSNDIKYFDLKIDVCKWFTRQLNDLNNGVYDISIRKNGLMCKPEVIDSFARANAYNYYLDEYACPMSQQLITFYYEKEDGTVGSYSNNMALHNKFSDTDIVWYLLTPYVIPNDLIENNISNRCFDEKLTTTVGEETKTFLKVGCNCVAVYEDEYCGQTVRYVVTTLGCGHYYAYSPYRDLLIESEVKDDDTGVLTTTDAVVDFTATANYMIFERARDADIVMPDTNYILYYSAYRIYEDGTEECILSGSRIANDSRMHLPTNSAILFLASYLLECDEDEEVDFANLTVPDCEELIRSLTPKDTSSGAKAANYRNYFPDSALMEFGNTRTRPKKLYAPLKNVFKYACHSDNTYAIYCLMLHIYKGLTHVSKDTVAPCIESKTSWDEGHIEISFPEAYRSNVLTAGGESSLQYKQDKVKYRAVYEATSTATTEWDDTLIEGFDITSNYYTVDLSNDYITFDDFTTRDCFTLGLVFKYSDLINATADETVTATEKLIATIGDARIYHCYSDDDIYSLIACTDDIDTIKTSNHAIKIIDGNQQIYLGIEPPHLLANITGYDLENTNAIITLSYYNGLWDIQKYYEGRGH